MRRVGVVFLLAVILPSLVLAWLAVRALRDQQYAIERQQSLLGQGVADDMATAIADRLESLQAGFAVQVEELLLDQSPREVAPGFDVAIRERWPTAEVGFAVNLYGALLCPSPDDSPFARVFCEDNSAFLGSREVAEVYGNVAFVNTATNPGGKNFFQTLNDGSFPNLPPGADPAGSEDGDWTQQKLPAGKLQARKVSPVQQTTLPKAQQTPLATQNLSRLIPAEAEFFQLVGDASDGMLARFVQNELKVMFWHRAQTDRSLVFGAQLRLPTLVDELRQLIELDPLLRQELCLALLDDTAQPVALSHPAFSADWRRPFVASEISEALPHWEVGVYLLNPEQLARTAQATKLTLGLLVSVLILAIGVGSWLILVDVNRQLRLTRQKTDFVSNVSHELKTPLTSIRMFSELLAEGKVPNADKQRSYLQIIAAESARLTRLINNVLDFARAEKGEKKYEFTVCDLNDLLSGVVETYRPHLDSAGFKLDFQPSRSPIRVRCDRDAISQVVMNLLSNAEKYSNSGKEITITATLRDEPVVHAEVQVLDRGPGVPAECAEQIFEQFYRVNDALNSGVQGSGLGLTLARQIARAHGGELTYRPRESGGSCFALSLPLDSSASAPSGNRVTSPPQTSEDNK